MMVMKRVASDAFAEIRQSICHSYRTVVVVLSVTQALSTAAQHRLAIVVRPVNKLENLLSPVTLRNCGGVPF